MKNRRNIIVAFLLCACLIVGVGYAALSDTLDITGSADVTFAGAENAFNEDIHFAETITFDIETAEIPTSSGSITLTNTATVNTQNNDKASFTLNTLQGAGDEVSITFTIVNEGDVAATVTPKLDASLGNTNTEYFSIVSDWNGETKDLAAHGSITYTLTVTLLKTPTEPISGSFLVELTANSVDA